MECTSFSLIRKLDIRNVGGNPIILMNILMDCTTGNDAR